MVDVVGTLEPVEVDDDGGAEVDDEDRADRPALVEQDAHTANTANATTTRRDGELGTDGLTSRLTAWFPGASERDAGPGALTTRA